jgi:hypothetical protein
MTEEDAHDSRLVCSCTDCSAWRRKRKRATVCVLRWAAGLPCNEDNCGTVCKCEPCMAREALELIDPEWRGI